MRHLTAFLLAFLIIALPARAEEPSAYAEELARLNDPSYLQSSDIVALDDILNKDLQDASSQEVARLQDLLIDSQGKAQTIVAEMSSGTLENQTLFFGAKDIASAGKKSGFTLAYNSSEIESRLPEFLAGIETAAGGEESLTSARTLKGRTMRGPNGERVATVRKVLTDAQARKVLALVIGNITGASKGGTIAMPFDRGLQVKNTGFDNEIEIEGQYAETIKRFAGGPGQAK